MGYCVTTSNPNKAMRLARQLVKRKLDWADLEGIVSESIKAPEYRELLTALEADYVKKEQRLRQIDGEIEQLGDKAEKLFNEYSDLRLDQETTKIMASFQLGYATALRLLDRSPNVQVINGGIKETKLRGKCSL